MLAAVQVADPLPRPSSCGCRRPRVPDDAGLELLEPVGERYAFVSDAEAVRPLLTRGSPTRPTPSATTSSCSGPRTPGCSATAPLDSTADRLQDLLADLAEVATALEQGQNAHT